MGEESGARSFLPLSRHRLRRLQGIPTVTVLHGEPEVAEWVWERWQRSLNRDGVSVRGHSRAEVLGAWLSDETVQGCFRSVVMERTAVQLGLTPAECSARLLGLSQWQFDDLLAVLVPVLGCSAELLGLALRPHAILAFAENRPRRADEFASVARLLGPNSPALLVLNREGEAGWSDGIARSLTEIAETAPHIDLGIAAGHSLQFLAATGGQRDAALLREGVLRLDEGSVPQGEPVSIESVGALRYDRAEFARSHAERTLYRHLESRSTTQGLFVLNARLDERFGPDQVEVDLLSERLRLALEVDGYHHFRDSCAYRRDRRKDVLLQELGYLVVRVLASDVTEEPEHVLELIDRAVARRSEALT